MDIDKLISCILCLMVCGGPTLIDSQPHWLRSRIRGPVLYGRPGLYGRYLEPGFYPDLDLYGSAIVRDPLLTDRHVVPVHPVSAIAGRPNFVSDRSSAESRTINIVNNNNNIKDQSNSGNVQVNQVSSDSSRSRSGSGRCAVVCDGPYECPSPYQSCVYDPSCGSRVCHIGIMI
ncbi:uncharacterized protein LOC123553996 [Mercenaria mercenaria]|uniref:uncharacterized protein LOC123553996 n=1 Tax=Mercenaria mercenaria TaxID=6596 RepID=UPI00234E7CC9|nr:uncharacterized protein LOC123553996 [Mercenaria mercenaria]